MKVCLAEVRRCRPFLIVMLGDRYGWVPPADRVAVTAREEGFGGDLTGFSVTDLEVRFGILDNPAQLPRSFFYFRESLPYAEMPAEQAALFSEAHSTDADAADRSRRLVALKYEIATKLHARARRYQALWDGERQRVTGLEAWGRQVLKDIWSELETETAIAASEQDLSWQQAETNALDDFMEDRGRDFVGRHAVLSRLLGHAISPALEGAPWGICLTGAPGSGKSAIFCELLRQMRAKTILVLAHATGASLSSVSVEIMLRRWIDELAAVLGVPSGLPDIAELESTRATFRRLLGRAATSNRVVLVVDALDQFEATAEGRHMTWLPHSLPPNVRLIATTIPGKASEALGQRPGLKIEALGPLDLAEMRGITEGISARYHRSVEPDVLDALSAKHGADGAAWGNPLWLVLAVEELNLLDADDFARATRSYAGAPDEKIRNLMLDVVAELPIDIPGLYRTGFERAEELFGVFAARAFIGLIAVSRAGWRESDFRSLVPRLSGEPWNELRFASMRRLFRGQLRQRGSLAQWDFAHAQMRSAANDYLAAEGVQVAGLHAEIAEHLLQLPPQDPLRQTETMVHLIGSQEWNKVARFYGDSELTAPEIEGATQVLTDGLLRTETCATMLEHVRSLLDALTDEPSGIAVTGLAAERLVFDLDRKIRTRSTLQVRKSLHACIKRSFTRLAAAEPKNSVWQRDLSPYRRAKLAMSLSKRATFRRRLRHTARRLPLPRTYPSPLQTI